MWRALLNWWKRFGRRLGDFQARALLIVFYFVFLGPFALVVRWLSDPLTIKARSPKGWRGKDARKGSPLERALAQS